VFFDEVDSIFRTSGGRLFRRGEHDRPACSTPRSRHPQQAAARPALATSGIH